SVKAADQGTKELAPRAWARHIGPMTTPFKKMNGLGNDFVVLDARTRPITLTEASAARIADRANGIGCDQVIILENAEAPADTFMRIFNQDGREVTACGNATRCVARELIAETGKDKVIVETKAGFLRCYPAGDDVTVDMGVPKFEWQDIPLDERMDTRNIDIKLGPIDAPVFSGPSAVNVGNPHCIFFVDDVDAHDIYNIGPLVEFHPLFPEQTNVSLAQVKANDEIRLRVWERGVGVTRACGTAACAVVPAGVRKKLCGRNITVTLDGGPLTIEWRERDDHILMTGPVMLDYEGELEDSYMQGVGA
ncbi:MAG TPA: diaminopimelate epimerase, partial [Gammaproteobacteria bacterium]|nr:diaminopimelate epimerase [Gammaproteobacteria bacterium]